jgi:hypothetical protein
MKFGMKVRMIAASAVSIGALAAGALAATPANAAPVFSCGGNDCSAWVSGSATTPTIRTYPPSFTFFGHFELQTPNHEVFNSITSTWHAGGTGNFFNNIPGGSGSYCITAWEQTGTTGFTKIGGECISA